MASEIQYRSFSSDLEVRGTGDGRTVRGIAAPFDEWNEVVERATKWHPGDGKPYLEAIRRGAFARTIAERGNRVKFLRQHDPNRLIGRADVLREDAAGLYAEFRVSDTVDGNEALELIRDGALDGLSIGFRIVRDDWQHRTRRREIHEIRLHEVSAVTFAAYAGAQITGVRSTPTIPIADARRRLTLLKESHR